MRAQVSTSPIGLPRFAFVLLCLVWSVFVVWANLNLAAEHAKNSKPGLPFGVFSRPHGEIFTQDFSYNLLFLRGVREHVVAHPYRFVDQEKLMRHMLPESTGGMTHAYSPVILVLALPFLSLSGAHAYLLYTLLCATGVLLLYYFYFMPRMEGRLQVYAFLACTLSICVMTQLTTGQSALITTTLIGALWCLLQRRTTSTSLVADLAIAALFWALCAKPSVAIIPGALLLGERAWRPLALSIMMLATTWFCVADYYGGWWTGFWDYVNLLNHYNNAHFTPYLQRISETPGQKQASLVWFSLDRGLVVATTLALIVFRWARRITPSQLFQGMVWVFLLLSPYLMGSEYWILCLLIVEGTFFKAQDPVAIAAKLVLLAGILDLRAGVTFPWAIDLSLKWLLVAWIVFEGLPVRKAAHPQPSRDHPEAAATAS